VKTNLFFKFYGGPNTGLLHLIREHLTVVWSAENGSVPVFHGH
jgi:hypothetical protein